jgi:hypothetical protein
MIITKTCYCLKNMKFTLHFQNILNITNFCDVLHIPSNFLSSSRISFTFPQNLFPFILQKFPSKYKHWENTKFICYHHYIYGYHYYAITFGRIRVRIYLTLVKQGTSRYGH